MMSPASGVSSARYSVGRVVRVAGELMPSRAKLVKVVVGSLVILLAYYVITRIALSVLLHQ